MPNLTISEAARAWNAHRDTVKRWVRTGAVEASKDNSGTWRIAEGQQPPPSASQRNPGATGEGIGQGQPPQAVPAALEAPLGSELASRYADMVQALALSQQEAELLREALARSEADRLRLHELLRVTLSRPSLLERIIQAFRAPRDATRSSRQRVVGTVEQARPTEGPPERLQSP